MQNRSRLCLQYHVLYFCKFYHNQHPIDRSNWWLEWIRLSSGWPTLPGTSSSTLGSHSSTPSSSISSTPGWSSTPTAALELSSLFFSCSALSAFLGLTSWASHSSNCRHSYLCHHHQNMFPSWTANLMSFSDIFLEKMMLIIPGLRPLLLLYRSFLPLFLVSVELWRLSSSSDNHHHQKIPCLHHRWKSQPFQWVVIAQAVLWPGVHGLRGPWDDQRHHPLHHLLARTLLCLRTIRLCHRWCSGWRENDPNWQKSSSIVSGEKCNLCQRAALKSTEPSMPGVKYIQTKDWHNQVHVSTDCQFSHWCQKCPIISWLNFGQMMSKMSSAY